MQRAESESIQSNYVMFLQVSVMIILKMEL